MHLLNNFQLSSSVQGDDDRIGVLLFERRVGIGHPDVILKWVL